MTEQSNLKMTVVTFPDYHMDPGASRLMIVGAHPFATQAQDAVGQFWPEKDVTLYIGDSAIACDTAAIDKINWMFYQFKLVDTLIIDVRSWGWVWPVLSTIDCDKYFVDDESDTLFSRSLNLTYPGRVFHNPVDAVKAAASRVP